MLFAFLGNLRAGLIVAAAIPLSMLFAGDLMLQSGIAASLLSLGAVDFGLIVDGAVVMVENSMRRLAEKQHKLGRELTAEERLHVLHLAPLGSGAAGGLRGGHHPDRVPAGAGARRRRGQIVQADGA